MTAQEVVLCLAKSYLPGRPSTRHHAIRVDVHGQSFHSAPRLSSGTVDTPHGYQSTIPPLCQQLAIVGCGTSRQGNVTRPTVLDSRNILRGLQLATAARHDEARGIAFAAYSETPPRVRRGDRTVNRWLAIGVVTLSSLGMFAPSSVPAQHGPGSMGLARAKARCTTRRPRRRSRTTKKVLLAVVAIKVVALATVLRH
jgi:hypothetical protein